MTSTFRQEGLDRVEPPPRPAVNPGRWNAPRVDVGRPDPRPAALGRESDEVHPGASVGGQPPSRIERAAITEHARRGRRSSHRRTSADGRRPSATTRPERDPPTLVNPYRNARRFIELLIDEMVKTARRGVLRPSLEREYVARQLPPAYARKLRAGPGWELVYETGERATIVWATGVREYVWVPADANGSASQR